MPARLIIAYLLILVLVAGAAGVVWWNVYHSRTRIQARDLARQRQAAAARAAKLKQGDQVG